MSRREKQFDEDFIKSILENSAPISSYYVSGGLRYFCDSVTGQIMLVMDDDDDINSACIKYLKKQGIPEFMTTEEEEEYIKYLQDKIIKSN